MRIPAQLSAAIVLAGISPFALAQVTPGYTVTWGVQSVPLSPWASVAISVMLAMAAYAYIKRHAGPAAFMLAMATLVGGLVLHADRSAYAVRQYDQQPISTTSGALSYTCGIGALVTNIGSSTITLTVTPVGFTPILTPPANCATGSQLAPNGSCTLPCPT
jgi:hypothetical protein